MGLNVIRGEKNKKQTEWLIDHYYMELFSASDQNRCAEIVYDSE